MAAESPLHATSLVASDAPPRRRAPALDMLRGWLMVHIVVDHALANLTHDWEIRRRMFGYGGTGFTLVSGMLLGYFFVTRGELEPLYARYRQQAMRLLFVVHPLMSLLLFVPHAAEGESLRSFFTHRTYITDLLAVIFLAAPLLKRFPAKARVWTGLACLAVGRLIAIAPPLPRPFDAVEQLLGGSDGAAHATITSGYPFLGCVGTILIGIHLGDRYGRATTRGEDDECVRDVRKTALAAALLTLALVACWALLRQFHVDSPALILAQRFLYPDSDAALVPLYAGVTLLLFSVFLRAENGGVLERFLVVFGKTSLFTYVLQYLVVETLPAMLGFRHHLSLAACGMLIAGAIPVLFVIARTYNEHVTRR